jgi:hypothetical protein
MASGRIISPPARQRSLGREAMDYCLGLLTTPSGFKSEASDFRQCSQALDWVLLVVVLLFRTLRSSPQILSGRGAVYWVSVCLVGYIMLI